MISPLLLLLVTGATSAPDVVARVDDVVITRVDVEERRRVLGARARGASGADLVEGLVNDALLAAEARRRGLHRDPIVAEEIEAERRRVVSEAYLASLADAAPATEAQLRQMYHATSDVVRLKLVKLETRKDAEAALARVRAGGDIESEAARSLDPSLAMRRGDTGLVVRAALPPPIAAEAFKVETGTVIGPVELPLGWAIAELVERRIADEAGFAARRASIERFAREQTMAQTKQHLLEKLGGKAKVVIDEPFLASLKGRTSLTAAELDHVIATVNGRPLRHRTVHAKVAQIYGAVSGHGSTLAVTGIARGEVEQRLLADEADARGMDRAPAVAAVFPGIERNVLAAALAERTAGAGAPQGSALGKLVGDLRRKARVSIDREKVGQLGAAR